MTRKAFEAAVRGKTPEQVTAAVGRPDDTREKVPGETTFIPGPFGGQSITYGFDWWVYRGRVINEATGQPYRAVAVRFGDGRRVDQFEYP
jgi:hypothetical protein